MSLKKYRVSKNIRELIEPNKADNVSALKLLKIMSDNNYNKVNDGKRVSERVTPKKIAKHSRSFRRCLRVIEVNNFTGQSKYPDFNY